MWFLIVEIFILVLLAFGVGAGIAAALCRGLVRREAGAASPYPGAASPYAGAQAGADR